MIIKKS